MTQAHLPDGTVLNFPDDTPDNVIDNVVKSHIGGNQEPEDVPAFGISFAKTAAQGPTFGLADDLYSGAAGLSALIGNKNLYNGNASQALDEAKYALKQSNNEYNGDVNEYDKQHPVLGAITPLVSSLPTGGVVTKLAGGSGLLANLASKGIAGKLASVSLPSAVGGGLYGFGSGGNSDQSIADNLKDRAANALKQGAAGAILGPIMYGAAAPINRFAVQPVARGIGALASKITDKANVSFNPVDYLAKAKDLIENSLSNATAGKINGIVSPMAAKSSLPFVGNNPLSNPDDIAKYGLLQSLVRSKTDYVPSTLGGANGVADPKVLQQAPDLLDAAKARLNAIPLTTMEVMGGQPGNDLESIGSGLVSLPGKSKSVASQAFADRQIGVGPSQDNSQKSRLASAVSDAMKTSDVMKYGDTPEDIIGGITKKNAAEAGPLFDADKGQLLDETHPILQNQFVQDAIKWAKANPEFRNMPDNQFEVLDEARKQLGNVAFDPKALAKDVVFHKPAYAELRQALTTAPEFPNYENALKKSADNLSVRGSFQDGMDFMNAENKVKDIGSISKDMKDLSDPEKEAYKAGAAFSLQKRIQDQAVNRNAASDVALDAKGLRGKLTSIMGKDDADDLLQKFDAENSAKNAANRIMGNSQTADKLANQENVGAVTGADNFVNDLVDQGPRKAAWGATKDIVRSVFNSQNENVRNTMGKILFETDPDKVSAHLDDLKNFAIDMARSKNAADVKTASDISNLVRSLQSEQDKSIPTVEVRPLKGKGNE